MKLTDLEPQFIRYESKIETWEQIVGDNETWRVRGCPTQSITGPREHKIYVNTLSEAQGIIFLCPKCFKGSNVGVHLCEVTFANKNVSDDLGTHNKDGKAVRWNVTGNNCQDLTTTPSVLLEGGCAWHGYITNGDVSCL